MPLNLESLQLRMVTSVEDALEVKRWLGERRPSLAVDTETSGLDPRKEKLRLVQIGDLTGGWAWGFEEWKSFSQDVLKDYSGRIVGHNFKFDEHFCVYNGVKIPPSSQHNDTMIMAHLLDATRPVGLKPLSDALLDPRASAGQHLLKEVMSKNKVTWGTIPIMTPEYWGYGIIDTCVTAALDELFAPLVKERGLTELYDIEMATSSVLGRMERKGIRIDVEMCKRKYDECQSYLDQETTWFTTKYGINPGSTQDLVKLFLRDGLKWDRKTPGGKPSVDEESLNQIAAAYPDYDPIKRILDLREVRKVASTYFMSLIDHEHNGRIHCSFRQLGAETGRMSCTSPALQTIPKSKVVRDVFLADDEDSKLIACDYAQMEVRAYANWARDAETVESLRSDDFHSANAKRIFNLDGEPTKKQRGAGKVLSFMLQYGAGAAKVAASLKVDMDEGKALVDAYHQAFPRLRAWSKELEREAQQNSRAYGRTFVRGHKGRIHNLREDQLYKAVNYRVQGGCATLMKEALVSLDAAGLGDFLQLTVHDEVICSVPIDQVESVREALPRIMSFNDPSWLIDLPADASEGMDRWGDKEE